MAKLLLTVEVQFVSESEANDLLVELQKSFSSGEMIQLIRGAGIDLFESSSFTPSAKTVVTHLSVLWYNVFNGFVTLPTSRRTLVYGPSYAF